MTIRSVAVAALVLLTPATALATTAQRTFVASSGSDINGQGGLFGISFIQGARLSIEDCEIANAQITGILIGATGSQTAIRNTVVRNNQVGVYIDGISGASRCRSPIAKLRATRWRA